MSDKDFGRKRKGKRWERTKRQHRKTVLNNKRSFLESGLRKDNSLSSFLNPVR